MASVRIPNNWQPRPHQMGLWNYLEKGGKRAVAVCHRRKRWGKDDVALHWAAVAAQQRIGNYWHLLPQALQARKAIWDAINPHSGMRRIDEAFPKSIRKRTDNQSMMIEFKRGSTWQVVGSDNFNSLVGSPPVGVVLSEWALADPSAWAYMSPILRENGGWAAFIYTPRGRNHGHSFYKRAVDGNGWFGTLQGIEQTKLLSAEELKAERADYHALYGPEDGDNLFEQEYNCSFDAAILGAYYGKLIAQAERNKRVMALPYNPEYPVHTGWDIGIDDATAIFFFQEVGRETWVINYYEARNRSGADIAADLGGLGYVYGTHYMPHDADQREKTSARTYAETMRHLIKGEVVVCERTGDSQRIHATRQFLPRCLFSNSENVGRGLEALRSFHVDFDTKTRTPKKLPKHDWSSHPASAFGTYAENRPQRGMRASSISPGTYDNPMEHGEEQGARLIKEHHTADPKSGFRPSDTWKGWDQREFYSGGGQFIDEDF